MIEVLKIDEWLSANKPKYIDAVDLLSNLLQEEINKALDEENPGWREKQRIEEEKIIAYMKKLSQEMKNGK